jgi:hypothetical protein
MAAYPPRFGDREEGHGGYDAVQLASALTWQESVGMEVIVGTLDHVIGEIVI